MLSGNGRHRRPRQVPALVVTAGVTGSALAMPLLAATSATAADTSTWDKVAECESGGSWSANFGSGAYGGLQFTQEEWQSAGGLDFAERPDLASRSQQIAVAERVLGSTGPQAWPLCAASAGLVRESPAAQVDPGLPGGKGPLAPAPSRPDDAVPSTGGGKPSTDYGSPTPAPAPSPSSTPFLIPDAPSIGLPVMPAPDIPTTPPADPTAPVQPGGPTGTPTPVDPTAPTLPVDPAAPTTSPVAPGLPPVDPTAPAAPEVPQTTSATPVEGSGKHRGAPETLRCRVGPHLHGPGGRQPGDHRGCQGRKGGWNGLYQANEQVIGEDADLIKPGQNLDLTPQ